MSKNRTSPDKQTNEDSDLFKQNDNANRARLTSLSDTTLQDLPMELIELILIKAVAMEVMGITRKKSLWKETAEPVISRLTTVCSQWTKILTTNSFQNKLHRTFDAKTIRLELVQTLLFEPTGYFFEAVTLKDEVFILYLPRYYDDSSQFSIHVYDRNNVAEVKDVIPLAGIELQNMEACNVSNCLYLLVLNSKAQNLSVLRVTRTVEHQHDISPLISGLPSRDHILSVAANGNLVLAWQRELEHRAAITVYGPDGHLQHEIRLSSDVYSSFCKVIPKSTGSFVLVSTNDQFQTKLTEIDMNGTILRQYQSSLIASGAVCQADKYGRIAIFNGVSKTELLDSELNLLEYTGPQLDKSQFKYWSEMHYNRERNEVITGVSFAAVAIFRFIQE